jgi:quercetin dioxygenase-like cupin family protein
MNRFIKASLASVLSFWFSIVAAADGFVLKIGEGEVLLNGIVVKVSPENGTEGSILVEQTFQLGGKTVVHLHEQGDELFYVVSGQGSATLGDVVEIIGPGDVVFVPAGTIHQIKNLLSNDPLVVVFFMDSPELVDLFRAIHERVVNEPGHPITPEEIAEFEAQTGGGKTVE